MPLLDTLIRLWLIYISLFSVWEKKRLWLCRTEQKFWKRAAVCTEPSVRLINWLGYHCLEIENFKYWAQLSWNIFNLPNGHALPSSVPKLTCLWPLGNSSGMHRCQLTKQPQTEEHCKMTSNGTYNISAPMLLKPLT